jgi:hypothetical protein
MKVKDIQKLKELNTLTEEFEITNNQIKKLIELIAHSLKLNFQISLAQLLKKTTLSGIIET